VDIALSLTHSGFHLTSQFTTYGLLGRTPFGWYCCSGNTQAICVCWVSPGWGSHRVTHCLANPEGVADTVLSFGETWETTRPAAFGLYQLNSAENNYPVHEKELLAIVKALKKWRSSLLNVYFKVMTDHHTLESFQAQKDMSHRQSRWSMYMADFDYEIHYVKGEDNSVADALSCLPNLKDESSEMTPLVAAV
jgi:hypothetical protein